MIESKIFAVKGPPDPKPGAFTWIERQALLRRCNEHLAEIGRTDVHWVIRDGRLAIEWKSPPTLLASGKS